MASPSSHQAVLSVTDLSKSYVAANNVVNGVSFDVHPGEIVGLLGPNGAGKTSTINMILSVLTAVCRHHPYRGDRTSRASALGRRHLMHTNFAAVYAPLPGNLTVSQNLRIFGMIYGVKHAKERIEDVIRQFDLTRFRDTKCGALSSGEQTRAALAKAMLNRPTLLLLDEPTASLDPSTARDIRKQIRRFADEENGAVLWTSHNMYEVEEVCDRVMFLSRGRILLSGDPKALPGEHHHASLEDLFIAVAREPLSIAG